jgi:hypothetical protein
MFSKTDDEEEEEEEEYEHNYEDEDTKSTGDEKVSRHRFELVFIRSKRFDKERGTKGALCRSEFLDLLVRMIHSRYPRPSTIASNIPDFISDYFIGSYYSSPILLIRSEIRSNNCLNALIHDNRHFL